MLYWIPNQWTVSPALLGGLELLNRVGPDDVVWRPGPDLCGRPGVYAGHRAAPERLAPRPGEQAWTQWGAGAWWLVREPAEDGPGTLRRPFMLRGYELTLGDGNDWIVPIVRELDGALTLPAAAAISDTGEPRAILSPEHAALAESVGELWRELLAQWGDLDRPSRMGLSPALAIAAAALGLNYRVGMEEVAAMGLLTHGAGGCLVPALHAVVDWPRAVVEAVELAEAV